MLTHEAEGVTVDTPAGKFENCSVWSNNINFDTCKAFYKDGVGIVKQERSAWGYKSALVLSSYSVKGNGILPLDKGNTWEYSLENCPEKLDYSYKLTTAMTAKRQLSSGTSTWFAEVTTKTRGSTWRSWCETSTLTAVSAVT